MPPDAVTASRVLVREEGRADVPDALFGLLQIRGQADDRWTGQAVIDPVRDVRTTDPLPVGHGGIERLDLDARPG